MLSFGILPLPRTLNRIINKIGQYCLSSTINSHNILNSQFHIHGVKHFQKSRLLNRQSTTVIFQIDKLITQLEKQRLRMKELKETEHIRNDSELVTHGQCSKYFDIYGKLEEKMAELKINEEWGFRLAGWYNIQPLLDTLIDELLDKGNKPEHNSLIESIGWMKPNQLRINIEDSVQELIKQKGKIDNFYKQLPVGHSIDTLKEIESIFEQANTNSKGRYYQNYLISNIDSIIENASKSEQDLKNVLWIIEMYVITYNDDPKIIQKIENFFLNSQLIKRQEVIKLFFKIYAQMGRANQQIYRYIKQHIKQSPSNIIQIQILNLQFLIHSEANDLETLNEIFKNIAKISKSQSLSAGHKLHVHYLLHYLKIKNTKFTFPFHLFRQFSEICRTFEEDGTFAKTIAVQLDEKSRREGVQYFNSSCLLKKKDFQSLGRKKRQGEPIQKADGFKKFKDIKFCCLNIDYCVYDENNKKGIILQKNYHRFTQSGRLIRMEEVKAEILRHYGLEINYMETRGEISRKLEK